MKVDLIHAIEEEFQACPEAFGGPVSIQEVEQAEKELQMKLPESFKQFLQSYGSGGVGEVIVLGLREAEWVSMPSFVEQSLRFRTILPKGYENFVVIGIDGAGNPVGFSDSDGGIISFDFDFGGDKWVASSLEEYIEKVLKGEIGIQF